MGRVSDEEKILQIVLSTYNGADYLPELLQSLDKQDFQEWKLLIRDDGSSDATMSVIANLFQDDAGRVELLQDNLGNIGSAQSFGQLLAASNAPYVMLADQDDWWLERKISDSLAGIKRMEEQFGSDTPILLFTDAVVVDEQLTEVSDSFWRYQKLSPQWCQRFKNLLVQNVVLGCTIIANRALLTRACPIPTEAVGHDWWLALVAAALGKIGFLDKQTMLYRQHGGNSIGALKHGPHELFARLQSSSVLRSRLAASCRQASVLASRYGNELTSDLLAEAVTYAGLPQCGWWEKRLRCLRYGYRKNTRARTLGLLAFI